MTVYHHRAAAQIANFILGKWKNNEWLNDFISSDIELTGNPSPFPSPDAHFQDKTKRTKASIEFKPYYEGKRGMMTGLGQTIGYLNKAHIAVLTTPKIVVDSNEEFPMANFLKKLFKKYIFGKLPIALVSYEIDKNEEFKNISLEVNIDNKLFPLMKNAIPFKGSGMPYWAYWRDLPPDGFYKYTLTANNTKNKSDRSDIIWDNFFNKYYIPKSNLETLEDIESNIFFWDMKRKMIGAQKTKFFYRKIINDEKLTTKEERKKKEFISKYKVKKLTKEILIKQLKRRFSPKITDNLYEDNKKNWNNFMNHAELWDENFALTPLGKRFIERVEQNPNNPKHLNDEFAQIFLVAGKHEILIKKIIDVSKDIKFENKNDYLDGLYKYLDEMGYIAKNKERSTTGVREFFRSETQLWHHHGIQNKDGGDYFFPKKGFSFDLSIIENLVEKFYKNYGDVYRNFANKDELKLN